MSAAMNRVVPDGTTSTFDQVKETAAKTFNWIGRQVQWLANTLKDIVMKIVETVKPFFVAVFKFIQDQSTKVRDYIVANKEVFIPVGITIPFVLMLALGSWYLFCGGNTPAPANRV